MKQYITPSAQEASLIAKNNSVEYQKTIQQEYDKSGELAEDIKIISQQIRDAASKGDGNTAVQMDELNVCFHNSFNDGNGSIDEATLRPTLKARYLMLTQVLLNSGYDYRYTLGNGFIEIIWWDEREDS